jgi:hypothetical protein
MSGTSNNSNSYLLQIKYFTAGGISPKNYLIFHYGMEVGKMS